MPFVIGIKDIIDIVLVAAMLYYIYRLMKESRSLNVFIGIMVFMLIWLFVSQILEMRLLGSILDKLVSVGALAIIILFQEEIRKFLYTIGAHQRFRLVKVGDMRAFSDMLNAGKVKSIRIVGDSISDGVGLPGYSTAPRGTAIAYKNGDTIRYESSLTLATYSNAFRKYATSHGVKSFVTAGISGWKMSQFAANPDAWLQGGADVVVVSGTRIAGRAHEVHVDAFVAQSRDVARAVRRDREVEAHAIVDLVEALAVALSADQAVLFDAVDLCFVTDILVHCSVLPLFL